ncbi:MAG: ATP-dependent carboxylate-amine ligase [Rhodobacteraceae bacterium]|nr:ATP-dependent carboxylate-amine ligase [Paracoccaceae bacterium]
MIERSQNYLANILSTLCAEIGASLFLEPVFQRAGYIEFKNGKKVFFKGTSFDINGQGAAQIAKDKDYSARFLAMSGLQVPEGVLCFSPRFTEKMMRKNAEAARQLTSFSNAIAFAEQHGYPLIVKPNEGSEGDGVRRIVGVEDLCLHISKLFNEHERVLVQRQYDGSDYRVVVLDGNVISAYRRIPLNIVGDGTASVIDLMQAKAKEIKNSGRNPTLVLDQFAISEFLAVSGRSSTDIPGDGEVWPLLPNANLSMGGEIEDVTDVICPEFSEISAQAASALGLRYAGVDILCSGIHQFDPSYIVLEVNSAPGLNNFGRSGKRKNDKVVELYRVLIENLMKEQNYDEKQ